MIVAVSDTGPLLHLHEAGALEILPKIACVSIPFAATKGLATLQEARRILFELKNSSFWLSPKVFYSAEKALDEIEMR